MLEKRAARFGIDTTAAAAPAAKAGKGDAPAAAGRGGGEGKEAGKEAKEAAKAEREKRKNEAVAELAKSIDPDLEAKKKARSERFAQPLKASA